MALSPLERLPTELLQNIFFLSDSSLTLPSTSHLIGAKLSSCYIYNKVCAQYFTKFLHFARQQSQTQTWLLTRKWFTWHFLKTFLTKHYETVGCLCGRNDCTNGVWPPDFEDPTSMEFSPSHMPQLGFAKCRMPTKLLHGPWTTDKTQFLRFLLWITPITVDWADPGIRHMVLAGKQEAIMTRNLEVVELFNHFRRLGQSPSMATVRFAVLECGCDRSIVYDTMATARAWGLRGKNWNCPELDAWCRRRIEAGDLKGSWLQLKLKELRTVHGVGNEIWNDPERTLGLVYGIMDLSTGNYDGGDDDQLLHHPEKWAEMSPHISRLNLIKPKARTSQAGRIVS